MTEPSPRAGIAEIVAAAIAVVLFAVLLAQIVLRALGAPLVWVEEFSTIAFVCLVFAGAAAAFQRREHLDVDLLYAAARRRLSDRAMASWRLLVLAFEIVFLAILAVGLGLMARQAWSLHAGSLPGFRYGYLYLGVLVIILYALAILLRRLFAGAWRGELPGGGA